MTTYIRCEYIPDGGLQCDSWFKSETGLIRHCPLHEHHVSNREQTSNKESYMGIRNTEANLCHFMSLEDIDTHIAGLELVIETERAKLFTARSVRTDKLDKLSDEERAVRRAIKTEKAMERAANEAKPKKVTIKNDPIQFFMVTYGISEQEAKVKLGLE